MTSIADDVKNAHNALGPREKANRIRSITCLTSEDTRESVWNSSLNVDANHPEAWQQAGAGLFWECYVVGVTEYIFYNELVVSGMLDDTLYDKNVLTSWLSSTVDASMKSFKLAKLLNVLCAVHGNSVLISELETLTSLCNKYFPTDLPDRCWDQFVAAAADVLSTKEDIISFFDALRDVIFKYIPASDATNVYVQRVAHFCVAVAWTMPAEDTYINVSTTQLFCQSVLSKLELVLESLVERFANVEKDVYVFCSTFIDTLGYAIKMTLFFMQKNNDALVKSLMSYTKQLLDGVIDSRYIEHLGQQMPKVRLRLLLSMGTLWSNNLKFYTPAPRIKDVVAVLEEVIEWMEPMDQLALPPIPPLPKLTKKHVGKYYAKCMRNNVNENMSVIFYLFHNMDDVCSYTSYSPKRPPTDPTGRSRLTFERVIKNYRNRRLPFSITSTSPVMVIKNMILPDRVQGYNVGTVFIAHVEQALVRSANAPTPTEVCLANWVHTPFFRLTDRRYGWSNYSEAFTYPKAFEKRRKETVKWLFVNNTDIDAPVYDPIPSIGSRQRGEANFYTCFPRTIASERSADGLSSRDHRVWFSPLARLRHRLLYRHAREQKMKTWPEFNQLPVTMRRLYMLCKKYISPTLLATAPRGDDKDRIFEVPNESDPDSFPEFRGAYIRLRMGQLPISYVLGRSVNPEQLQTIINELKNLGNVDPDGEPSCVLIDDLFMAFYHQTTHRWADALQGEEQNIQVQFITDLLQFVTDTCFVWARPVALTPIALKYLRDRITPTLVETSGDLDEYFAGKGVDKNSRGDTADRPWPLFESFPVHANMTTNETVNLSFWFPQLRSRSVTFPAIPDGIPDIVVNNERSFWPKPQEIPNMQSSFLKRLNIQSIL